MTTDGELNPAGCTIVYCNLVTYMVVPVFVLRALCTIWFLHDLVRRSKIEVVPFHPDNCGGLKPVGQLGLRNQHLLTIVGINIVLMATRNLWIDADPGIYVAAYLLPAVAFVYPYVLDIIRGLVPDVA